MKTKRCSSLKEGCDPQSKLDRRHQLLKINAVDIEGLGRSIHWSSWGSINWLGLVWGTYPSLPAGCTWEQSCSSASIFAPQTSISELVFSLLDILMPTLQGGHHQLILLTPGSSSISGLLGKWNVIEKLKRSSPFNCIAHPCWIWPFSLVKLKQGYQDSGQHYCNDCKKAKLKT